MPSVRLRLVWEDAPDATALAAAGWRVTERRAVVARQLHPWVMPVHDPFDWEPLVELDDDSRHDLLDAVLFRTGHSPVWVWDQVMARTDRIAPEWAVACLDGRRAGLILPCIEDGSGWVDLIGLCPRVRGRGLGRVLHAVALDRLARAGADRYEDETDADNTVMRRVFARNGCQEVGIRLTLAPPGRAVPGRMQPVAAWTAMAYMRR